MGKGNHLPNRLEGLREHEKLPQHGSGQSPGQKLILVLPKRQRILLVEMFVTT